MRRQEPRQDQDSPWKELLTYFFPELIQLVHPELYNLVDWTQGVRFLDTELQRITPKSQTGRQTVDKLAQVYLTNGDEQWILVHIEVQSHPETQFEERLFAYHARIWLHYRRPLVSLAILADKNPHWRPQRYERSLAGCRLLFEFYTVKLLDMDEAALVANENPSALVLLAFRRAMATEGKDAMRLEARKELVRLMVDRGYDNPSCYLLPLSR
ncbi:MAG: hypothetical protein ABDI19_07995 [Armatimonadota bacterium]